ncbi:hypothetical protein [Longitalea arenae]|uniref:hypothetical protein n=1 Tax=Longitalea arenae TaxID=2812558 RepID=UPI001967D5B2|nr:hypothetical protein [Longitalea arenae]
MKLVGFIKEYNNLKESIALDDLLNSRSPVTNDVERIFQYLDQGVLVLGWMGYFMDVKTKQPIAPDSYFTDGVWVWPAYFPYYLNMFPFMQIDPDFVQYLIAKDYKFEKNFEDRIDALEDELARKFKEVKL